MQMFLVDDNPLFLEGLSNMLEAAGIRVVGTATSGRSAVAQMRHVHPDVVLMDVQMPGECGIDTTRLLKGLYPSLRIVMMTVSENDNHLFDAIAAGASGYLLKSMAGERFVAALEGLHRGETPLSPGLAGKILTEFSRRDRELLHRENERVPLSVRQTEILRMVSRGMPYKEIASKLALSEATIKYHMGEITDRLHLANRAQVIAYATKHFPELTSNHTA